MGRSPRRSTSRTSSRTSSQPSTGIGDCGRTPPTSKGGAWHPTEPEAPGGPARLGQIPRLGLGVQGDPGGLSPSPSGPWNRGTEITVQDRYPPIQCSRTRADARWWWTICATASRDTGSGSPRGWGPRRSSRKCSPLLQEGRSRQREGLLRETEVRPELQGWTSSGTT